MPWLKTFNIDQDKWEYEYLTEAEARDIRMLKWGHTIIETLPDELTHPKD